MRRTSVLVLALVGLFATTGIARADQLFVCQPSGSQDCTSAPGGTAVGGESNLITTPGSFDIGLSGNATDDNPLLVIIAVFNGTGATPPPTVTFGGGVSTASLGTYGLTSNPASLTSGTVWTALGLAGGGSESFGNFSGADSANGFGTPGSFELFAFALNTAISSGSPITLGVSGAPAGSFILAYACQSGQPTDSTCSPSGNISQTVFTNVGLIDTTPVPEPASLALVGSGLFALAGAVRRRRQAKS
jgi:PEP-CTERM motif